MEPLIWQWWIQERGPAPSPLILDQNEARMAEKFFWEIAPLRHLSKGLGDRLPPPPHPHPYSGENDNFPGSQNLGLNSIQGTLNTQNVTDHENRSLLILSIH